MSWLVIAHEVFSQIVSGLFWILQANFALFRTVAQTDSITDIILTDDWCKTLIRSHKAKKVTI